MTKPEHVASILALGLYPGHRRGMTCDSPSPWRTEVFLTDDPAFIAETQLSPHWPYQLLAVDCTGLTVRRHTFRNQSALHELVHDGYIAPDRLSLAAPQA